jgi:cytochrome b6-f complex iron-sulfur subunit
MRADSSRGICHDVIDETESRGSNTLMRRLGRRGFLAAAAFLAVPVASAAAASGPTLPPLRVGERIVFGGYEWRGVRRGKSLVWRRGATVKVSPPQPRPSASAATNASQPAETTPSRAVGELGPVSAIPDGVTSAWAVFDSRGISRDVYIVRRGSSLTALDSTCTHAGCVVALSRDALRCGCHGATFDAVTGVSLGGPGGLSPLARLGVVRRGDTVFIEGL